MKQCLTSFAFSAFTLLVGNAQAQTIIPSQPGTQIYTLAQSGTLVSTPADTSEDTLATITVPANAMGANGCLTVDFAGQMTNNANVKTLRARFGGASGTVYFTSNDGSATSVGVRVRICNANATNSQYGAIFPTGGNFNLAYGTSVITSAVDTTTSTTLVITGQKAVAGDTLSLLGYSVTIAPSS